jgi:hypothetical protein
MRRGIGREERPRKGASLEFQRLVDASAVGFALSQDPAAVMAGLVPAIHAKQPRSLRKAPAIGGFWLAVAEPERCRRSFDVTLNRLGSRDVLAWMAGTSPRLSGTKIGCTSA